MSKVIPKDKEYFFDDNVIISQTDIKGIITYGNRVFFQVSGYKKDELIGQSHNILRHPDMPKEVFKKMWKAIQSGQAWNGLIKNLRKDGLYYWVETEILPVRDNNDEIIGYIAARKAASRKDIQEHEEIYQKMLETQK
ncbi:PAS domain-containing protein [Sulfurimonas sp.]|uniref:PAS domain-containing protein n=1 Tax=Sulfurimonas sp. TaxID=2022749 RepID=UPI00262AF393|nr:PAS domain-containing protein [Sulfurimonas sp.]